MSDNLLTAVTGIAQKVRGLSTAQAALLDRARVLLMGKMCQKEAGSAQYAITNVGISGLGDILVMGVRVYAGKRHDRELHVGVADQMHRIWAE